MDQEILNITLRTAELLEGKLSTKLAADQSNAEWLTRFRKDDWRNELLETIKAECPDNPISRILKGDAQDSEIEKLHAIINESIELLDKDEELTPIVKEAKKGAKAVTLGITPEMVELITNLATISMPIALVLAARIKSITPGGLSFFKGIPPEITVLMDKIKPKMP